MNSILSPTPFYQIPSECIILCLHLYYQLEVWNITLQPTGFTFSGLKHLTWSKLEFLKDCWAFLGASQVALVLKNPSANAGDVRRRFDSCVRNIPWRRKWQPTLVLLPGKSRGQRSLIDYSPCVHKESDRAEWIRIWRALLGTGLCSNDYRTSFGPYYPFCFKSSKAGRVVKAGNPLELWLAFITPSSKLPSIWCLGLRVAYGIMYRLVAD